MVSHAAKKGAVDYLSFLLLWNEDEEVAELWSHIPGSCGKARADPGVCFGSLAPGEPAGSREELSSLLCKATGWELVPQLGKKLAAQAAEHRMR